MNRISLYSLVYICTQLYGCCVRVCMMCGTRCTQLLVRLLVLVSYGVYFGLFLYVAWRLARFNLVCITTLFRVYHLFERVKPALSSISISIITMQ